MQKNAENGVKPQLLTLSAVFDFFAFGVIASEPELACPFLYNQKLRNSLAWLQKIKGANH